MLAAQDLILLAWCSLCYNLTMHCAHTESLEFLMPVLDLLFVCFVVATYRVSGNNQEINNQEISLKRSSGVDFLRYTKSLIYGRGGNRGEGAELFSLAR